MASREPYPGKQFFALLVAAVLAGCNTSFHDLGTPPAVTEVGYDVPVDTVLIPPEPEIYNARDRLAMQDTSIWNHQNNTYFRDNRAYEQGDILTVEIFINDSAKLDNNSERQTELEGNVGAGTDLTLG
ncbi:MAG: flagellar basal body L-ring protein FlgH, partial [Pseudomonadota bacterium]